MPNEILDDFSPQKSQNSSYSIVFQLIEIIVFSILSAYQLDNFRASARLFQHSIMFLLANFAGWNLVVILLLSGVGNILKSMRNQKENKLDQLSFLAISLISSTACFLILTIASFLKLI